jgi:hypothetical protein
MKSAGIALISAAVLVAGGLLYEALGPSPLHAPDPAVAMAEVDRVEAEARQTHPRTAPSDAMKEVAVRTARQAVAQGDATTRARYAAGLFLGAYIMNMRARPAWCRQRGVDLTPFTTVYARVHRDELVRTRAIFAGADLNAETAGAPLGAKLMTMVDQDMRDFAANSGIPLDRACALMNTQAEQMAQRISLPQEVRQALFAER